MRTCLLALLTLSAFAAAADKEPIGRQESETGLRHSFVISGAKTARIGEDSVAAWEVKRGSKDASQLLNGNYLVIYGREAVELTPDQKVVWKYTKSAENKEIMSGQRLADGVTLLTELGSKPQLVEVDPQGKITRTIPIIPETNNSHMQTRMARKLAGGTYLVPHRIMPFTKEYDATGKVLRTFRTDLPELGGPKARNGTFGAARLANGNTVITCTNGNKIVEMDKDGKPVWVVTSKEVGGIINDVCGLQVLKSGNFVVSCYGNQKKDAIKMFEITKQKKVVWKFYSPQIRYVHNLQILTTNGKKE